MADYADDASALEEVLTNAALASKKKEGPAATGCCLNCGEPLADGRRWCDAACRDDYEYREARGGV